MKKALFSLILLFITYVCVELLAYAAYRITFGKYQIHDLHVAKQEAVNARDQSGVFVPAGVPQRGYVRRPILHPYVGFVLDAKKIDPDCESDNERDCQTRVKVDTDRPFAKRSDTTAIVGILGGSFADGTARGGSQKYFDSVMKEISAFKGKEIIVYNMAAGAYKQPQQLMQLAYYLSLGAEFDVIINLDGLNEMAGTYYDWRDADLHPAFPKSWNHRVSSALSKPHLQAYSEKYSLLESRSNLARFASGFPQRWSPLVNFTWRILDPGYVKRVVDTDTRLAKLGKVDKEQRDFAYEALGPDHNLNDWAQVADYTADLWANSSLAMRDLAEGHGARYYHFLQPNQYIAGAKILTEQERKVAIVEQGGYGNVYRQSIKYLQDRFETLKNSGVHFYDLTYMFQDVSEILYIDNCCHLNSKGYNMVARKLMETIQNDYYDLKPSRVQP